MLGATLGACDPAGGRDPAGVEGGGAENDAAMTSGGSDEVDGRGGGAVLEWLAGSEELDSTETSPTSTSCSSSAIASILRHSRAPSQYDRLVRRKLVHRVLRAFATVTTFGLLTYGVLFVATVEDSEAAAPPAITPDPQVARMLRKDEKPHASKREQQGIFVPPQEDFEAPRVDCEPGAHQSCMIDQRPEWTTGSMGGRQMRCVEWADGSFHWDRSACNTPLVVSFTDAPVTFTTPSPATSAAFPIGISARTEWVSATTPWLAIDSDGSGCIEGESELFGGTDTDRNGFDKLAHLDENHDGRIDESDPAFAKLVLWADRDQDKRCTPKELTSVRDAGLVSIDLHYARAAAPSAGGSFEGERATLVFRNASGVEKRGHVVDVYLAPR